MSSTEVTRHQRFALMAVVPLTGVASGGALYPRVMPGDSGLRKVSFALTDQVRSVDKRRIVRVFGEIRDEELAAIEEGLRLFLGLS
jgi:mRNA-degrading endonuclease toxin of MazEF toxin-antitoxin module